MYVTDALGGGDKVTTVKFAEAAGVVNTYPIAVLKGAPQAELAQKFVDLVTGRGGPEGPQPRRFRQALTGAAGLPRWIYIPAAVGASFVVLPLLAMAVKVDWPNFWSLVSSPSSTTALVLSLLVPVG